MPYNLIDERWIPVRRASGARELIAPWEISDRADPALQIDSGRPDFDGALIQFLIGLVQTAAAPADRREWRKMFDAPPEPEDFRTRFETVREAFNLDGDGPRFMQDLTLFEEDANESGIEDLLIDSPGEFDHFVKRNRVTRLSFAAVAAALFTLQTNAPSGGRGHRTGLRGGGPLTTLVSGRELTSEVLLNVLPANTFAQRVPGVSTDDGPRIFPWLARTVTSEKDRAVTPEESSPLIHFWAMPRRIRVVFAPNGLSCDLYPEEKASAQTFRVKSYGNNYKGAFLHPLTPYALQKDGSLSARKGRLSAFEYRDWVRTTLGNEDSRPSAVINEFFQDRARIERSASMSMFGYDMSNDKAVAFRSGETLLIGADIDEEARRLLAIEAERRIASADSVQRSTRQALDRAWRGDAASGTPDLTEVQRAFWSSTEPAFYGSLRSASSVIEDESALMEHRETWLHTLHETALRMFDEWSGLQGAMTDLSLRNIARARRDLVRYTHPNGARIRKECGLPAKRTLVRTRRKDAQ